MAKNVAVCIFCKVSAEMNSAIIDVRNILGVVGAESHHAFEREFFPVEAETAHIKFLSPVIFDIVLENTGSGIRVKGHIKSSIELECSRCLSEFAFPVDWNIDEIFYTGVPLEEDGYTVKDEKIDLGPPTEEEFVLAIPIKPLCDEACKGICPICGQPIDEAHKPHEEMKIDARLEILKKLLKEEGRER
jgi:uncharacterized protein